MRNHMRVVWAAFALLVALFVAVPVVLAALTFKSTGSNGKPVALTLLESRCSDAAVLKHLVGNVRPEFLDKFRDARLLWDGKTWASCWMVYDGMVYSVDAEGTPFQPIPLEAFRESTI